MHHHFPDFDLHDAERLYRLHGNFMHCRHMQGWLHFIFCRRDPNVFSCAMPDKLGGHERAQWLRM